MSLEIYTDGACRKGSGAFAFVVMDRRGGELSHLTTKTHLVEVASSNQMELMAVLDAVTYVRTVAAGLPAIVICDCAYIVSSLQHGWPARWAANGWLNAKGRPIAHQALWKALLLRLSGYPRVEFKYVRGHGRGDPIANGPYRLGNHLADTACRTRLREYLDAILDKTA